MPSRFPCKQRAARHRATPKVGTSVQLSWQLQACIPWHRLLHPCAYVLARHRDGRQTTLSLFDSHQRRVQGHNLVSPEETHEGNENHERNAAAEWPPVISRGGLLNGLHGNASHMCLILNTIAAIQMLGFKRWLAHPILDHHHDALAELSALPVPALAAVLCRPHWRCALSAVHCGPHQCLSWP